MHTSVKRHINWFWSVRKLEKRARGERVNPTERGTSWVWTVGLTATPLSNPLQERLRLMSNQTSLTLSSFCQNKDDEGLLFWWDSREKRRKFMIKIWIKFIRSSTVRLTDTYEQETCWVSAESALNVSELCRSGWSRCRRAEGSGFLHMVMRRCLTGFCVKLQIETNQEQKNWKITDFQTSDLSIESNKNIFSFFIFVFLTLCVSRSSSSV